jgi:DNA-directed RNA polymerase subunit N
MIIPIRCFTCGKVIASYYEQYLERKEKGEEPQMILDEMGLSRYCCRRMIIAHIDLIDEALPFG